ncbi:hypothetical protein [Mesorhizobium sp. BR-1-1-10]|nr:hypothetical protein [Mesorhizobium sp. BR-1-1-10]
MTYTPIYHPETRTDRIVDWCERNLLIVSAGFAFGALYAGMSVFC